MITALTIVFNKYMATDFESFTAKYMLAKGMFQLLEPADFSQVEYDKIIKIGKYTHPDVQVSLYKLDRVINPSKGEFSIVAKKFTFNREDNSETVTLDENAIQKYLCMAISEVHDIMMRIMKKYKIEQSMETGDDDSADLFKV